jgi:hypothetical protein
MTYEVFTADSLFNYITSNILYSDYEDYYSDKLASFDEVHVIEYCPNELARLGLGHKVILNMTWIKYLENPYREKRITKLLGYLERYSTTFNEALRVYNKMKECNIEPNVEFFKSYAELLEFLGGKMQIC